MFKALYNFIINNPWWSLLILVGTYWALKILIRAYRFFEHLALTKRFVYLRITQPRKESQKDKDNQVEKDFRERIAIMAQFFRNIHEIRELNLWNIIRTRIRQTDKVIFEMVCQNKLLDFIVICPREYQSLLEKQITSYYPDSDVQEIEPYTITPKGYVNRFYYAYLSNKFWFPTKTFKTVENDPLNSLSNVFSKLDINEKAGIQIVLRPRNARWRKTAEKKGEGMFQGRPEGMLANIPILGSIGNILYGVFAGANKVQTYNTDSKDYQSGYVRMLQTKEEIAKQIGEKANQVGFDAAIRVFASAKTHQRVEDITNNIIVSFNLLKHAGSNWYQTRRVFLIDYLNNKWMYWSYKYRILYSRMFGIGEKNSILVPEELASLYHFPSTRYNYSPTIRWLTYKILPAPEDMSQEGLHLGYNFYRGDKRQIYFLRKDRGRHHYIIGKSGSGKSTILSFMARQDIQNGDGVAVIDPHGDLVEELIDFVPKSRAKDVIIFNPADIERPMGLNILEADTPEQQDLASSQATEIFIKLFGDEIFGPRIQHYFRNACLTLMEDKEEGATLIDVPRIFVDNPFMKYKVAKVKNPVVRSFWEHEYANTGDRERQEMIPYFSSKFGPFITNSIMRNTIGQTKSAFDFRDAMDTQKILLVNLSKGKIGDLNTQLLGLVLVARIQMAAMSRADMPEKDRKDFYLYVDEFQNFATESFCSILSEARKYHLALIMAHQYIGQLTVSKFGNTSTQIRDAVFGNVGSITSFKIGAEDGEYMAKEMAPALTEQDIINIANYKAYMKMNIRGTTSRPFSLETIYDLSAANKKIGAIVREYSRIKHGRKKEFVDQEISARIGIDLSADDSEKATDMPNIEGLADPEKEVQEGAPKEPNLANEETHPENTDAPKEETTEKSGEAVIPDMSTELDDSNKEEIADSPAETAPAKKKKKKKHKHKKKKQNTPPALDLDDF